MRRPIDYIHATADLVPAVRGYEMVDTPLTRRASDHLPVVVDVEV